MYIHCSVLILQYMRSREQQFAEMHSQKVIKLGWQQPIEFTDYMGNGHHVN